MLWGQSAVRVLRHRCSPTVGAERVFCESAPQRVVCAPAIAPSWDHEQSSDTGVAPEPGGMHGRPRRLFRREDA